MGTPPNSRRPPPPSWVGYAAGGNIDTPGFVNALGIQTWVPVGFTATQMGFRVGVASGNMQLAIYDANGARIGVEASFAVPASGNRRRTLTTAVVLPEGPLSLVFQVDNNTASFGFNFDAGGGPGVFLFANAYASGLPATLPALTDGVDLPVLTAIA